MTEVFADTFYWLAGLNSDDAYHQQVKEMSRPGRLVTTWAVQLEVMDAFCEPPLRALAVGFWQETQKDPDLVIVALDEGLLSRAAVLFASRNDKKWSLTDCISFTVMQDRRISAALTRDHHFEQAGFQALFR